MRGIMTPFLSRVPRWGRLLVLGALAGVVGGLAAAGFDCGLSVGARFLAGQFTHLGDAGVLRFHWGVLLLPAAGGLVSGIAVRLLCPQAFGGQGTDLLVRAFHHNMGRLRLKGPLVKGVGAVWVIACGGSAGPEGPMAALGAAIGSTVGRMFRVTPRERRILLIAGCGAGVGAIFQCPLGGALFAASVLYREPEFEADAIVPSVVSSVLGYSTFMLLLGFGEHVDEHMLSGATALKFSSPIELIPYALLGLLCGGVSIFFSVCMRTVEKRLLPWSRLPRWFAPALGGLATGALACLLPQIMDGQYHFVQNAMDGKLFAGMQPINWWWWVAMFAGVVLVKCMATGLTLGSGASGGVLGPSVFIGGAVGAFLGALIEAVCPGAFPEGLRAALIPVGMGGVLAGAMRTPLAAIVMVTEMTGSYGLIVPSMLVCVSAYVVGRGWGLNHEQVRGAAESPAHAGDAVVHMLESWRVEQLTERNWPATVTPDTTLAELVKRIEFGTRPVFAVVRGGNLLGLISTSDIQRIMDEPGLAEVIIAADMMAEGVSTVYPEESVYQALNQFRHAQQDVLPVVSRAPDHRWQGMLTRARVFKAIREQVERTQRSVLREHRGLTAIEHEGQLQELVTGLTPSREHEIQRLLVPLQAVGKSLREADFRKNFGAQIIAIEQPDGSLQCPPDIDAPLRTEQRLVALVCSQTPSVKENH